MKESGPHPRNCFTGGLGQRATGDGLDYATEMRILARRVTPHGCQRWVKRAARPILRQIPSGVLCALALSCPIWAQGPQMQVQAGFQGFCKDSEWFPVMVRLYNRGREVTGSLAILVPTPDGRTSTTFSRPVQLGSRAAKDYGLYVQGSYLPPRLTVRLQAERGPGIESEALITPLLSDDSLIAVLGRERGALSFLSGTPRGVARDAGWAARRGWGGARQSEIRVADVAPDFLPDLPRAYASLDLLVIGDISARELRPEVQDAVAKWVEMGGSLVVMGGPDWGRLRDPFFRSILPVEATGAREVQALDALAVAYGSLPEGPAVVTTSLPKSGASVLLSQGDIPLIARWPVGSGEVAFLAFDCARPPVRGWAGQAGLWNDLLSSAQGTTPLLREALSGHSTSPYGYGGYPGTSWLGWRDALANSVLNIPAMRTPPFGWVAAFLVAYVLLLVPINYQILKWRKRLELAWVTTPALVVMFSIVAYVMGYSMKGGRLLLNQLSLVEARAGARTACVTSFAGLFSPAKTTYDIGLDTPNGVISDVPLRVQAQEGPGLTVLEGEGMLLQRVPMNMWSMRVFRMEGSADLGRGLDADLALSGGRVHCRITNRTGFNLSGCQVRIGSVMKSLNDLRDGSTVTFGMNVLPGVPSSAGGTGWSSAAQPSPGPAYPAGGASAMPVEEQMRAAATEAFFAPGRGVRQGGGPILSGWAKKRFVGLTVDGRSPQPTHVAFVIFHLPLRLAGKGPIALPYGMANGSIVEMQSAQTFPSAAAGVPIEDGYVVKEFRLPVSAGSVAVERLDVYADFASSVGRGAMRVVPRLPGGGFGTVTTVPGPGGGPGQRVSLGQVSLQVHNWRTGAWDALSGTRGNVAVPDAPAHVRLPDGLVRVKFVCQRGRARGLGVSLNRLDISLRGHVK
jgi:hypothetical protein